MIEEELPRAVIVAEGDGWSALLPGVAVHGDAKTYDGAIDDLIQALREYAEAWDARLSQASNHAHHRHLVEFVQASDDAYLRAWLTIAPSRVT